MRCGHRRACHRGKVKHRPSHGPIRCSRRAGPSRSGHPCRRHARSGAGAEVLGVQERVGQGRAGGRQRLGPGSPSGWIVSSGSRAWEGARTRSHRVAARPSRDLSRRAARRRHPGRRLTGTGDSRTRTRGEANSVLVDARPGGAVRGGPRRNAEPAPSERRRGFPGGWWWTVDRRAGSSVSRFGAVRTPAECRGDRFMNRPLPQRSGNPSPGTRAGACPTFGAMPGGRCRRNR